MSEKTIGQMGSYIKQLLPLDIPDNYPLDDEYFCDSNENAVKTGVIAFRDYMAKVCDALVSDGDVCDIPIKGKKNFSDGVTLTVQFPFINNLRSILVNVGEHSRLDKQSESVLTIKWGKLSLKRSLNKHSTTKIPASQMLKSFRFLQKTGLGIEGIDLGVKKPDIADDNMIAITFPDDLDVLVGWKALGLAQSELANRKNDDILLRCDYRMLNNAYDDISPMLSIFVSSFSKPLQDFVLSMHKHYVESGMKCELELGFLCINLNYTCKKKMLWRFSMSYHNGNRLVLKTKKTEKYTDVINDFSDQLRDKILKGYGCDRKKGTSHGNCNHGCEGYSFKLDESLIKIGDEIKTWQDSELRYT